MAECKSLLRQLKTHCTVRLQEYWKTSIEWRRSLLTVIWLTVLLRSRPVSSKVNIITACLNNLVLLRSNEQLTGLKPATCYLLQVRRGFAIKTRGGGYNLVSGCVLAKCLLVSYVAWGMGALRASWSALCWSGVMAAMHAANSSVLLWKQNNVISTCNQQRGEIFKMKIFYKLLVTHKSQNHATDV